jgi:hypothetical protein
MSWAISHSCLNFSHCSKQGAEWVISANDSSICGPNALQHVHLMQNKQSMSAKETVNFVPEIYQTSTYTREWPKITIHDVNK